MTEEIVRSKKKIKLLPMICMMYLFISGGGFGLEDMIGGAGPGISLIILLILPIVWAYPYGLICTELGAKYTEEPGFYGWIRRALGKFPAYIAGWAMTLGNFVDTSVYLVLSMEYLNSALNLNLTPNQRWMIGLVFVVVFCVLNILGIEVLAFSATISGIVILLPFVLTIILAIPKLAYNPFVPIFANGSLGIKGSLGNINTALLVGFWMFMGYESLHSFSDEVEGAGPLISKAFMWAVPIATCMYILPTFFGLAVTGNWQTWSTAGPIDYVAMGKIVGGNFLMILFLVAGIVGNLGLYSSYIAFGSRITADMAEDGLFFKGFDKTSKKYGTPYVSIIIASIITAILSQGSFSSLIIIDVVLMLIPIMLIIVSGIVLRFKDKDKEWDCFTIKVGNKVYILIALLPLLLASYAIATTEIEILKAGIWCLVVGVIMYFIFPKINKKKEI
ncbi:APC family permease [Clostridium estertheticum]|uniref:APC family permease n=1 Tax=Clostridium estertheticum TaxID=238834 RepID=UPI0013E944A6|nr:APC family permease [Clostridium estertheticum]MBZ9689836.1 APC family permease [Clostridium estertheticum]